MKARCLPLVLLVASCELPSDNFPVADFALECATLGEPTLRTALDEFAKQEGLTTDLQARSPAYLRLRMDGEGFGHSTFIEFWSAETDNRSLKCQTAELPCIDVTVFTSGKIPDDEGTENTATQVRIAQRLERTLDGLCVSGID